MELLLLLLLGVLLGVLLLLLGVLVGVLVQGGGQGKPSTALAAGQHSWGGRGGCRWRQVSEVNGGGLRG
jgi:hypothetical protein